MLGNFVGWYCYSSAPLFSLYIFSIVNLVGLYFLNTCCTIVDQEFIDNSSRRW
jgi:hypothetical protein